MLFKKKSGYIKNHTKNSSNKREILIFFRDWVITNILFLFFLTIWIYFIYPDMYSVLINSVDMGIAGKNVGNYTEARTILFNYGVVTRYSDSINNDIEYRNFLQDETKGLTDHCEGDVCKVWEIIAWLHDGNESGINSNVRGIDPNGSGPCVEVSQAFMLLSSINDIKTKMCFTEDHAFVLAKINGDWMFVDPTNIYVGEAFPISQYVICKW